MSGGEINNPFGEAANLISGPIGQIGLEQAKKYMKFENLNGTDGGIAGKIFTSEIRKYFDVNTSLVWRKILKILFPFKTFEWDDQVKKLQLYIPIISFMTLILFSTIVEGITSDSFDPRIGKKAIWIMVFSFIEVILAKCTENTISNLNIGFLELTSLVSYRFVPLSILTIILTITNMSLPYLNLLGVVYLLISDTYFCKIELNNYARDMFKEEGLGSKIALCFHFVTTVAITWFCDLL